MSTADAVWSERDTTPSRIEEAMRELLRERHAADAGSVPARVLNLVVVVDAPDLRSSLARLQARRASSRGTPPSAQIKPKPQGAEP